MAQSCFVLLICVLALLVVSVQSKSKTRVRQCSCLEQQRCVRDLMQTGEACVDQCSFHTKQITKRPKELLQCFKSKMDKVQQFASCFQRKMKGCVQSRHGPMIPKQSINGILNAAEKKIRSTTQGALDSGIGGNLDRIISTAKAFGDCAKQCLIAKTAGGICLRKYKCQPLLPKEEKANQLFGKCLKIDLKKDGVPMCQCVLKAGVRDLTKICNLLSMITKQG